MGSYNVKPTIVVQSASQLAEAFAVDVERKESAYSVLTLTLRTSPMRRGIVCACGGVTPARYRGSTRVRFDAARSAPYAMMPSCSS